MPLPCPARHDFVWLDPDRAALQAPGAEALAMAADWIADGKPLISRRRADDDHPGALALGLALPERLGRQRLACQVAPESVLRTSPPPLLADTVELLDERWRPACYRLVGEAGRLALELRVYGSAGWERLTGERYLRPGSDLDLLVHPLPGWCPETALALFREMAGWHAPRLDGEVRLGGGDFASWRELTLDTTAILVKTAGPALLRPRSDVEHRLKQAPAP